MAHRSPTSSLPPGPLIAAVREGFPSDRLDKMAETLSVDRIVLLGILGVSQRTLQRKHRASDRLSPSASDRLSRVDRIFALAAEVLGAKDKAIQWLKRSSRALGNEVPLQLLDTDAGTQRVERELRQIQHGFVY
jgi:putative toxin-antitoxin system antitoxin component (TIGR02293 family)